MSDVKVAKLFRNGGSQAVRLPAEFRFDGDEVYISRDEVSGDLTLSRSPGRKYWQQFFASLDAIDIPQEDLDDFMTERPMNEPFERAPLFADEE